MLRIVLSVAVWVALVAYLVFAARLCCREKTQIYVQSVDIRVVDADKINIVNADMVSAWLTEAGFDFLNREIETINTEHIRQVVTGETFVKDARVYTDLRGIVHIEVSQRQPIARFNTADGYNFYLTDDGWVVPIRVGGAMYVPVITGRFSMPFDKGYYGSLEAVVDDPEKKSAENYAFMLNLINFVRFTAKDSFWNAQIVQIVVSQKGVGSAGRRWKEPEIEIVPRAGNFVVGLGTLVDVEKKLDTLMLFYRNVLSYEGWNNYRYISLKYRGQVVCTK